MRRVRPLHYTLRTRELHSVPVQRDTNARALSNSSTRELHPHDYPNILPRHQVPELDPQLVAAPEAGLLFADGERMRYIAPGEPGTYTAAYAVIGPDGQTSTADVTLRVAFRKRNNFPFSSPVDSAPHLIPAPRFTMRRKVRLALMRLQVALGL